MTHCFRETAHFRDAALRFVVVVRQDFAEKYPEVVVAFIEAVLDAGQWIDADPLCAADQLEKWTGVEKECSTSTSRKEAILRSIPMIKQPWVDA